jgi:hypothetical protein
MLNVFKQFFGRKPAKSVPVQRVITPFPDDYPGEARTIIKLVQSYDEEMSESEVDRVRDFYFDSIDWINGGEELDLDSFYQLIVNIMEHMRSEVSTDGGNDFRLDHELYVEGVQDRNFFLDAKNESFLLRIIALGPEADHFLCELTYDLAKELNQSFIDQSLDILLMRSSLNDCNHVGGWTEVSGNVMAEIIQSDRLSASQIGRVIKFLERISKNLEQWQLDACKFQLAQNSQTPSDYLLKLTQEQGNKFGWVKDANDNGEWVETSLSELAQRNLRARESSTN